jgi:glycosyltransferase involved in cell wall biosynthesis
MRIAMVHTTLPNPLRRKEGGVTMFVHRLANALVRHGEDVTVFSADPRPTDALYPVQPLPAPAWITGSFLGQTLVLPVLLNRVDWRGFDVIHTHGDDTFLFSRKRVRSIHGSALGELRTATRWRRRIGQALLYPLELLSSATAAAAIAQSEATRRHFPFVKDRIDYAVDTDLFHPGPKSAEPSILFVGTLEGRKRGAWFARIFERSIRPAHRDTQLWMVADRAYTGVGVISYGKLSEEDLASLFRAAWVFVLPSRYEGFGLPYLEAMASGTCVVASDNPGANELLGSDRYGLTVSDDALADTVSGLLGDPELRINYERQGLERAASYSWEKAVNAYLEIYERFHS